MGFGIHRSRERSGHLFTRAAERIQKWFRRDSLQRPCLAEAEVGSTTLEHALSAVRDAFASGRDTRCRVFVKGQPTLLRPEAQEQIYLISREALVNAVRHSEATRIETEVEYLPCRVRIVIRDNGCGIDPDLVRCGKAHHLGLAAMREQAEEIGAQLRVWSRLGVGTEVEILVPKDFAASPVLA
jgi:signal transduction histidine kinase